MSRESFSSLIYDLENDAIVHEYESLNQATQSDLNHADVDYIILNTNHEYVNQAEYFEQLEKVTPESKCLFIVKSTDAINLETLPEQIVAVITINSKKSEIVAAMRSIKIGQQYIGQYVKNSVAQTDGYSKAGKLPMMKHRFANEIKNKLTTRQCEVLDYMTKGYANKLIAYELGVSEGTVKLHVSSILRALNVTNRTEAAMRAGQYLTFHAH